MKCGYSVFGDFDGYWQNQILLSRRKNFFRTFWRVENQGMRLSACAKTACKKQSIFFSLVAKMLEGCTQTYSQPYGLPGNHLEDALPCSVLRELKKN